MTRTRLYDKCFIRIYFILIINSNKVRQIQTLSSFSPETVAKMSNIEDIERTIILTEDCPLKVTDISRPVTVFNNFKIYNIDHIRHAKLSPKQAIRCGCSYPQELIQVVQPN